MECTTGVVTAVYANQVEVQISRSSACAGCHARGACTSQDRREELLTIRHFPPTLAVGDLVRITGKGNIALRAVLFAFVLPILLILAGALVLSKVGVGDALMALSLLLILVMYALVLVLLRPFLDAQLALRAEPITQ